MNLLTMEHITKAYTDRVLLNDVAFSINENEKIGVIGINGMGKSTLLKVAAGIEPYDEGKISIGNQVKICYLPQTPEFEEGTTVLRAAIADNVNELNQWTIEADARSMLNKLGFYDYDEKVEHMSGGQKKRIALVNALLTPADILVLDDPTNDLDIQTLTILEDYLDHFDGIIITVSHDRYFLDRIVNRIFSFEGDGKVRQFEGGYSDYLIRKELEGLDTEMSLKGHAAGTEEQPKKAESSSKDTWKQREPKLKFTFKEQREFESIDDDIAKLEEKIETLDAQIAANATNSVKLRELMEKKEETENALDEKMDRWVYLNDLNEKIQDAKQQG